MRLQFAFFILASIISSELFAHCPNRFEQEKACFMLEKNRLYIYDQKFEHDGPYKDLKNFQINDASVLGKKVELKKIARGIFDLLPAFSKKDVELTLVSRSEKIKIKIKSE